ncbi:hypothetical protein MICRO11B_290098 [Micrococcus luteus]|nr:hypothetical protein MICRO11B_290098 [Micrococcus luteus]
MQRHPSEAPPLGVFHVKHSRSRQVLSARPHPAIRAQYGRLTPEPRPEPRRAPCTCQALARPPAVRARAP